MKKLIIVIFLIVILGVGGYFAYKHFAAPQSGEKGKINEVEFKSQYEDISKYAYKGEINYRTLYMVFKPTDFDDGIASEYECVIYSEEDGEFYGDSYYNVTMSGETVSFEYTSGVMDMYLEGTYDGNLTINNVPMEKINPEELKHSSYGYGESDPVTIDENNDFD